MLENKHFANIKNLMGFASEIEAEIFLKRLNGWIQKNGSSKISLAKGIYKIATDLAINQKKERQSINYAGIKHKAIIRHAKRIIELKKDGFGARSIAHYIQSTYKLKISHTTIQKFLQANKELLDG